jgi:colicin import membrane protein
MTKLFIKWRNECGVYPTMKTLVKRMSGRSSKQLAKVTSNKKVTANVSAQPVVEMVGQRGRRSMPAVKVARKKFSLALRKVVNLEKAIQQHKVSLVVADKKAAPKIRLQMKADKAQLKQVRKDLAVLVTQLRQVLAKEAAKSRALAQARAITLYRAKLQGKFEKDLEKAVARFASAWKKKRSKVISRKLKARTKKEASKALAARRRANAKAKASVKRAEILAKARARKVAIKARAKAKKLAAKAKVQLRLAVRKAARKARPVAVKAGRVSRKKRSK